MSAPDAGLIRQANKLFRDGHYPQAEQLFRRLLETDADNWQYSLMIGLCRRQQADMKEALRWLRRATELGDGQPATHYHFGVALSDMRLPAAAREEFAQALALDPNHVEARTGQGLVSLMVRDFDRAETELRTALRANEHYAPALAGLARALLEKGDVEAAHPLATRATELDRNDAFAQDALGRVFRRLGHPHFAEQALRNSVRLAPASAESHAELAGVLREQQRHRDALEHYREALRRNYGTASLIRDASLSLEAIGEVEEARRLLTRSIERWPDDPVLPLRLAELALDHDDPEAAAGALAGLDPALPGAAVARARLAEARGDRAGAIGALEPVVAAAEALPLDDARMRLARLHAEAEPPALEAARGVLAEGLDRALPDADTVLFWVGLCERAGQPQPAIEALERLLARDDLDEGDRRFLHSRLGNLHDRADELSAAWAHWRKGGWRPAPHAERVRAQAEHGLLEAWMNFEGPAAAGDAFEDGFPPPLIVAGWPGSGREMLLAGLATHTGTQVLDPHNAERRLEALGLPAGPDALAGLDDDALRLGRRRFMRGVQRDRLAPRTLEAGWWEASAVPALARHFPDLTVIWPHADPAELGLQWLLDGYLDVDFLVAEYRRELALWQRLGAQLGLEVIGIERARLLEDPDAAFAEVCAALGLAADADAAARCREVHEQHVWAPPGRAARYRPTMGAATGAPS